MRKVIFIMLVFVVSFVASGCQSDQAVPEAAQEVPVNGV